MVTTDEPNTPQQIGGALQITLSSVLESIPDCSMSPTRLSRRLGVSRVMVSRVVNAIRKDDPVDGLVKLPGPETLRSMVRSAGRAGVDQELVCAAIDSVETFARLIHDHYGTRSALNAALGVKSIESRKKLEQKGRYQVFKGISQLFGVECKLWLSGVVLAPSLDSDGQWGGEDVSLTKFASAIGLRRLRSDLPIKLDCTWNHRNMYRGLFTCDEGPIDLTQFSPHPRAPLSEHAIDGQRLLTFAPPLHGKEDRYDLIWAETTRVKGYATPDLRSDPIVETVSVQANGRTARGRSIIADFPTQELINDLIVHKDLFKNMEPKLMLYRTMGDGKAKLNDPARLCDVIETSEQVESIGYGTESLTIQEMKKYPEMVTHLCQSAGFAVDDFRTFRFRVQYPVYGFQYLVSFFI